MERRLRPLEGLVLLVGRCGPQPIPLIKSDLGLQADGFVVEMPPKGRQDNARHVIRVLDALLVKPDR